MQKKGNHVRIVMIVFSFICIILGILSNWREYKYRKTSIAVKASVLSVDIKPMSGKAVTSINYTLSYIRDNSLDTIQFSTTEAYSINDPLPTIEDLTKVVYYIHYVPTKNSTNTTYKDRVFITNSTELAGTFKSGWFTFMLVILIFGYLLDPALYRKSV